MVFWTLECTHYSDVIMGAMASQITGVSIIYSTVDSVSNQGKPQRSSSLAFVRGIHRTPVNSPHKGPVTRKMSPFDDVIMISSCCFSICSHDFPILNWPENLYTKYVHIGPDSPRPMVHVFLLEPREKPLYMYYQELRSCLHEGPPDKYTPRNNWLFILSSGCACLMLVSVHCRIDVFSVLSLAVVPFTNID